MQVARTQVVMASSLWRTSLEALLDTNNNGAIEMAMVAVAGEDHKVVDVSVDTSWVPVGDNSTSDDRSRFTGTSEGNGHTITDLWVNTSEEHAGLFGQTGGSAQIRIEI